MGFKGSFQGKAVLTALVLGTFAFSLPSAADAKRLHDPQVETKVEMRQGVEQGTSKEMPVHVQDAQEQQPLSERIQRILRRRNRRIVCRASIRQRRVRRMLS